MSKVKAGSSGLSSVRHAEYYDWLAWMDRTASTIGRGHDWSYPYFIKVRYPDILQPEFHPEEYEFPEQARNHHEQTRQVFDQQLAEQEIVIRNSPKGELILDRLDSEQRKQLAALVFDTIIEQERYCEESKYRKRIEEYLRNGKIWQGKRDRIASRIRANCEKLRREAARYVWSDGERHLRMINNDMDIARDILSVLDKRRTERLSPESRETWGEVIASLAKENPTSCHMVKLYWFFRSGCELTGDESEIRAAYIRNNFWTLYGVKPAGKIHETAKDRYTQRGCPTVKRAVQEYSRRHHKQVQSR